jgi:hypothetical protein
MKKVIRLTETDLTRIVKRVIEENKKMTLSKYFDEIHDELKDRFELSGDETEEAMTWFRDDIEDAFYNKNGYIEPKKLVSSFSKNGKLKWKR